MKKTDVYFINTNFPCDENVVDSRKTDTYFSGFNFPLQWKDAVDRKKTKMKISNTYVRYLKNQTSLLKNKMT